MLNVYRDPKKEITNSIFYKKIIYKIQGNLWIFQISFKDTSV